MVATEVHIEPAHYDRHSAISSHCNKEERTILKMVVVVHRDEDAEAGDADADGNHSEREPVFGKVGEGGDDHGKSESTSPWGH